jgi:hypothetical protein
MITPIDFDCINTPRCECLFDWEERVIEYVVFFVVFHFVWWYTVVRSDRGWNDLNVLEHQYWNDPMNLVVDHDMWNFLHKYTLQAKALDKEQHIEKSNDRVKSTHKRDVIMKKRIGYHLYCEHNQQSVSKNHWENVFYQLSIFQIHHEDLIVKREKSIIMRNWKVSFGISSKEHYPAQQSSKKIYL